MNQPKSPKIYEVRHLAGAQITIDGTASDPLWQRANLLDDFSFPWKEEVPPRTEFRALCDDDFLYLAYTVEDHDLVLVDDFTDKTDAIKEDRVEIFFALDWRLDGYYCLEIDPLGRALDYVATFHRQFDRNWTCTGLRTAASRRPDGYTVEAAVPRSALAAVGLPWLDAEEGLMAGIFRAEFSHGPAGETIEDWIAWINPETPTPDFHVPSAFGRLRRVK
jgi:hypothetical protein